MILTHTCITSSVLFMIISNWHMSSFQHGSETDNSITNETQRDLCQESGFDGTEEASISIDPSSRTSSQNLISNIINEEDKNSYTDHSK